MDAFAKKCIQDHRNPIVKVSLPVQKLFFGTKTKEEKKLVSDHHSHLKTILEHQRIEKRSARAQALWLLDKNVAQVTKVVKNLVKYFGFQNKTGIFLYPEEVLFLVETNRLEITLNEKPLGIEQTYEIVLKNTNITLTKYRVYKKLVLLGYKLIRFEQINHKLISKAEKNSMKRRAESAETTELTANKRFKTCEETKTTKNMAVENTNLEVEVLHSQKPENTLPKEVEVVHRILDRIRQCMPRDKFSDNESLKPDYCIFSPPNVANSTPDFNLFICEGNLLEQSTYNSNLPSIYATCTDDVSFYKFGEVYLPHLDLL